MVTIKVHWLLHIPPVLTFKNFMLCPRNAQKRLVLHLLALAPLANLRPVVYSLAFFHCSFSSN